MVVIALVVVCLIGGGLRSRPRAAAAASISPGSSTPVPALNAATAPKAGLVSLAGQEFRPSDGVGGVVVGEYEGYFDAATRSFTVQPAKGGAAGSLKGRGQTSRSDPGPVPSGTFLTVINSVFIGAGDQAGTVSGEVDIQNNTSATLYNTRIVFTGFKVCPASGPCDGAGQNAGNAPGPTGLAYFNDGQVAFDNKLHISRSYGDIPSGGNVRRIWTFATVAQPPRFFFIYKVIADLGVAAERVQPAAVQVGASTGTSVVINGRGFSGTPAVELMPASGPSIAMTGVTATATQVTATVPAGTAAGIYSVRVTNPGGAAGGQGSSTLSRKLTVTDAPSAGNTLAGNIAALNGAGPFLISGDAAISAAVTVAPGAVIYVANGVTITVAGGGNLTANGGIPGISSTNPAQIVFTAQRAAGAALPTAGAWGGINATAASTAEMTMRNVVVEYGGAAGGAQINLTGSGRRLRFTDSVSRSSAGAGIAAGGASDSLVGFARSRVDSNGSSASDPAMLLSGNAALGLFDLDTGTGGTGVGDASYYYTSANEFNGNQVNAIQIGTDADAASNDFTRSGVLVGQAPTPFRLRGNCDNPSIAGAAPPASPAELTITATAIIQLAPQMAFQAGDYASGKIGCIAANGYAGAYLGVQAATSNQLIEFDKIPGGANFGAIFFTRNAMTNCLLNYTRVQNGGNGANCGLDNGEVLAEVVNVRITNSQINNSATGGLLATIGSKVDTRGTTYSNNTPIIETVAGGVLGDGNLGVKANLVTPVAIAADPLGRGVYVVDSPGGISLIRFLNTSRSTATIGGRRIPAGVLTTVAGGGLDLGDNIPGRLADVGSVTGIGVSPDGEIVYFIDAGALAIRAFNASGVAKTIGIASVGAGNVGTFFSGGDLGSSLNGLAVNPSNGDVYVADATAGINKVIKIPAAGGAATAVAGNGAATRPTDAFSPGPATGMPLLQPRAITFDGSNNLYVADTGHGRVIKVDAGGAASLLAQFTADRNAAIPPYSIPPYSSGLAFFNGKLYLANGNSQDILRVDSPNMVSTVAGLNGTACDYTSGNCGDASSVAGATFGLIGSTGQPPLAGLAADSKGVFVLDQGSIQRGRVRYMNLSQMPAEVAGVLIAVGNIDTVAGTGLVSPFDGGLATGGAFNSATGVGADAQGNLWISDTLSSKLRFVNCGIAAIKIFEGTSSEQTVPTGGIVTVNRDVGSGATDSVPAIQAGFDTPQGVWVTAQGVYIADSKKGPATGGRRTGLLRFINTTGQNVTFYPNAAGPDGAPIVVAPGEIKTIAGGGVDASLIGDGGFALKAKFLAPEDVAVAANGDIYVADANNKRVRKIVRTTGIVSSVLVGGNNDAYTGISFDSAGRLLVANAGTKTGTTAPGNSAILREKSAGSGTFDTILSGSPLKFPRDVAEGKDGALYVTNAGESTVTGGDHKLLKIVISGATGTASTFVGSTQGYSGDGGPAASALINIAPADINLATVGTPINVRMIVSIIVTPSGEIIFTDSGNNAVRRIR